MEKLPIGTKITFVKNLTEPATGDHPASLFAKKGEHGEITGYNDFEGYNVKVNGWPYSFGAVLKEEFIIKEDK